MFDASLALQLSPWSLKIVTTTYSKLDYLLRNFGDSLQSTDMICRVLNKTLDSFGCTAALSPHCTSATLIVCGHSGTDVCNWGFFNTNEYWGLIL